MIKHIVMFKLKDADGRTAIENAYEAQKRAAALDGNIPSLKKIEAVVNSSSAPESNYEIALVCDFENIDDLNAYQTHPLHLEFGKFISSVRASRACIDYEY